VYAPEERGPVVPAWAMADGNPSAGSGDGGAAGPQGEQKGRFFVSTVPDRSLEDDDDSVGGEHRRSTVRQDGRFLVMTEPDEDDDEDFTSDEAASLPGGKPRLSLNSLNSFAESNDTKGGAGINPHNSSSQGGAFLSTSDSIPVPVLQSAPLPPLPPSSLGGAPGGPAGASSAAGNAGVGDGSNADKGLGPRRNTAPENPERRKQQPVNSQTLMLELQKISAQNHKLHRMLLGLTNSPGYLGQPAFPSDGARRPAATSTTSDGASIDIGDGAGGASLGPLPGELGGGGLADARRPSSGSLSETVHRRVGSDRSGSSGSTGEYKRPSTGDSTTPRTASSAVPKYDSTVRLQELAQELSANTTSIAQEYDALKMKNFVLTKQLKETKKQLKEANLLIENLREQLGKAKGGVEPYFAPSTATTSAAAANLNPPVSS